MGTFSFSDCPGSPFKTEDELSRLMRCKIPPVVLGEVGCLFIVLIGPSRILERSLTTNLAAGWVAFENHRIDVVGAIKSGGSIEDALTEAR